MYYNGGVCSLWGSMMLKIRILWKKLQIKVVRNRISPKKVCKRICLSPPRVEIGGSKDQYVWNLIMFNGKLDSLWGSTLPKIRMFWKKASNKSCSQSNFAQKSPWAHMSISLMSGTRGSKDQYVWNLIMYKNGKLDSFWSSTLPKIRMFWKKASNKSCSKSNFAQKSTRGHVSISPTN